MKTIHLEATTSTPEVIFGEDGRLLIRGRSIPEDVTKFYEPLIEWGSELHIEALTVVISLEYMNSASSKKLLYLLKILDANNHVQSLSVNWYYEEGDEDALENGQIYEELLLKASFRYYEYKEAA